MLSSAEAKSDRRRSIGRSVGHEFVAVAIAPHGVELTDDQRAMNEGVLCRCGLAFRDVLRTVNGGEDSICPIWKAEQSTGPTARTNAELNHDIDLATGRAVAEA